MTTIEQAREIFETIMCLCAEGPDVLRKMELVDLILKEAVRGFDLCKGRDHGTQHE